MSKQPENKSGKIRNGLPPRQGLYDPANEHDACGLGFVANIKNVKSHDIVRDGLTILENLEHRGAVGLTRKPVTVLACSFKCPMRFSAKSHQSLLSTCPKKALMVSAWCFCRPMIGARDH